MEYLLKINFHVGFLNILITEVKGIYIFVPPPNTNLQLSVFHFCKAIPLIYPILENTTFNPVNKDLTILTVLLFL